MEEQTKKHRERHSGRKAVKKKQKNPHVQELTDKQRNPKAFTFNSAVKAERRFRRTQDVQTKKQHIPLVDRTPVEPPPVIVAIVGPPKVGKTTLIQCLIKVFTKQPLTSIKGPVTLVSGKKRRLTIIECNNDINSMIDIAKVADLVLLLVDASFGFEMEIFEFLNICQVHGMPRVMGVLTHLDVIKNAKQLKRTKKTLKHRFWTEVYAGAKLFYLSGLLHDEYLRNEVKNLSRFISVMKFRPLTWRTTHPYILADRLEDLTPPERVRQNSKTDRLVSLYGYVRGIPLNKMSSLHIPGCGDHKIHDVSHLPDPCPLPDKLKKRSLVEKEKLIYAPFSGVGGIVYDKDAVYVELGGSHSHTKESNDTRPEKTLLSSLIDTQETLDMKMAHSELQLFTGTTPITATDFSKDSNENANPSSEEEAESNDERGNKEGSADKKCRKVIGSDAPPWKRNVTLPKKRKHSAIAEAEERLLKVLGDEDDHEDEDSEIEEVAEESEKEEEEMVEELEKEENVPRKKKKIEINEDENENSVKTRYRDIASEKDREIHNKISNMLTKLTNERPKKTYLEDEDAMESAEEDEDTLQLKKNKKNKVSAVSKQTRKEIKESDDSSESGIEEDGNESEKYDDENDYESSDDSDENGDDENEDFDEDNEDSSDEEDEDNQLSSSESDAEESAVRWKSNLAQKAADAFLERQATTQNLWKLVYGKFNQKLMGEEDEEQADQADHGEEIGGLFKVVSKKQANQQEERDLKDAEDCSIFPVSHIRDWTQPEVQDLIRDCFVTGKWAESEDAEELLRLDEESDGDLYGDFEDLETGEKHKAEEGEKKPKKEELSREKIMEKKRKLKEKFDAEYDEAEGGKSYYDELKQEVDHQAQLNKNEFEGMDEEVRIQLEGYRPGLYVRVEINDVPCELITNFDPTYPLILGGLQTGEENIGYVQVRIKKHRWHKKILKTRDPLIMSLGWRRFQTLPIFSKLEDNLRHRMLKYTPEHVTCMANFWGPITPQGTGILAIQNVADRQLDFRIAATGAVVELDKSTQVMKKLKLTGTPYKIYKKTAFIKGMFNSALEVAKFEGAKVKTVSGIRGQIKKAVSKPEGCFRATFEDKILLSDIVFCRTWYKVEVPKLYNPVTSLLLPLEQKNSWRGMKTVGQLKRERGIRSQVTADSLYLPIQRQPKVFRPLVIPRALQKELPYKDKPKKMQKNKAQSIESQRIAVVREPHEQKIASLMKMLKVSYSHKQEQLKQATKERIAQHRKEVEQEELKKLKRQKELRRQVFRTLSKLQQKNNKR